MAPTGVPTGATLPSTPAAGLYLTAREEACVRVGPPANGTGDRGLGSPRPPSPSPTSSHAASPCPAPAHPSAPSTPSPLARDDWVATSSSALAPALICSSSSSTTPAMAPRGSAEAGASHAVGAHGSGTGDAGAPGFGEGAASTRLPLPNKDRRKAPDAPPREDVAECVDTTLPADASSPELLPPGAGTSGCPSTSSRVTCTTMSRVLTSGLELEPRPALAPTPAPTTGPFFADLGVATRLARGSSRLILSFASAVCR